MTSLPTTIREFIAAGAEFLARHHVENPHVACELLACRLFKCPRMELFLHYDEAPSPRIVDAWRRGLKRVAEGEPLQYVLGEWDFRHLTLTVDRRALIPRPETEQLVDLVLHAQELWNGTTDRAVIIDVGTGSGCIVLSLATERPQARYVAIDASAEALELARANAVRCDAAARVEFRHASGCGEFPAGSVDAIVANLPYIPTGVIATLATSVREHEPHPALDGGTDGLDIIRSVARDAVMVLRPGGWLFLEIGDDQGPAVRELLEDAGLITVAILPDLAGKTRFAVARHEAR